ncbi:MAG: thiamine pyrophosphate-binding protein [Planctomycetota bacterium]|nr:thiamine pyrophosphate-binding protein [Planctomycetota bacterium]
MTGGELLIECLLAQQVDTVFGIPGIQTDHIYAALIGKQDEIRHILFRNEQSGSMMAEGYARASGRPGVCLTVPGPGATNAATGVAEAYSASTPLLLITGGTKRAHATKHPSRVFHGLHHDRFFDPITKWHGQARTADEIPGLVERAFQELIRGRPGPVHLEFPPDALAEETSVEPCQRVSREPQSSETSGLADLARRLHAAESPVILAGSGVLFAKAQDSLRELSETWQAPVSTSLLARGLLPEDHPLSIGCMRGDCAVEMIEDSDCVLAIGCRFTYFDTREWGVKIPAPLYCLATDDRDVPEEYPTEAVYFGDAGILISGLLEEMTSRAGLQRKKWLGQAGAARDRQRSEPSHPLISALSRNLPGDAITVADVHTLGYRMQARFPINQPRSFLYSAVYVNLGYGLPPALGAKIAFPDRAVVAVCGDGGFAMTGTELATAAQLGLDVKIIVTNDGGYSSIRPGQQKLSGGKTLGADLKNPDFMMLAKAYGIPGYRIESVESLDSVLQEAMEHNGPVLIELAATGELAPF